MSKDDKKSLKIKKTGIMNVHGKDIVTYEGVLDVAHQAGIKKLTATLLQFPTAENGHLAIASATATFSDGREFTDIGDASPDNVPKGCAGRYVSMAVTRAKGRTLSDALNIKNMVEDAGQVKSQEHTGDVIDVEYREVKQEALSAAPEVRNGGGSKPATQKQIDLIEMKGNKKSIDHHNYVYNKFGKNLDQLCGSEADAIIKELDKK
jgi:hypothetical protein